jgi:hypothetical protein
MRKTKKFVLLFLREGKKKEEGIKLDIMHPLKGIVERNVSNYKN